MDTGGIEGRRSDSRRPGETSVGELSVGLFALSVVAFSPPLLVIFGTPNLLLGLPLLYVYLFVAWSLVIVLLARLAKQAQRTLTDEREPPPPAVFPGPTDGS